MRTIFLEILEPTEVEGIAYDIYCDGVLRLTIRYGEYGFFEIDGYEHSLCCTQYAKDSQAIKASVRKQQSQPVRIPKGAQDLQIAIREELGQLRFVLQTYLPPCA